MAESNKKPVTYPLIILLLAAELFVLLTHDESEAQVLLQAERAQVEQILGNDAKAMIERTDELFTGVFVDTGVMAATMRASTPATNATEDFEKDLNRKVLSKTEHVVRAGWTSFYTATGRLITLFGFLPAAIILLLAAFLDGYTMRQIKLLGFSASSPQAYGFAHRMTVMLVAAPVFYALAPVVIPLVVLPVWSLLLALSVKSQLNNLPRM
jgi:hypothetical protein